MACCDGGILGELKALVNQIGDGICLCWLAYLFLCMATWQVDVNSCGGPPPCAEPCNPPPCCVPMTKPFAQVCMTFPPPILAPTYPQPVKPLQLPCPKTYCKRELTQEEAEATRYANFYNNYNIDYREEAAARPECKPPAEPQRPPERICEDYTKPKKDDDCSAPLPGCPTGFKPCTMKLSPPCNCDPNGVWCAQVQPCPPKPRKKRCNTYVPGPCTRPCCKHWQPKEGPCLYDGVCKAHCFNHPPGMKPSGRYP